MQNKEWLLEEKFRTAGFESPEELLLFAPKKYRDFRKVLNAKNAFGLKAASVFHCKTESKLERTLNTANANEVSHELGKIHPVFEMTASFGNFTFTLQFRNRAKKDNFKELFPKEPFYLFGRPQMIDRQFVFINPLWVPQEWAGRIMPVYPDLKSREKGRRRLLTGDDMRVILQSLVKDKGLLEKAADLLANHCGNLAPPRRHLIETIELVHSPECEDDAALARFRADDLGIRALTLKFSKRKLPAPSSQLPIDDDIFDQVLSKVPFALSDSQQTAIKEIRDDLRSEYPMNRLVSGDVGSGKTIIQLMAVAMTHLGGGLACIVTPNGVLAKQLYADFQSVYPDIPAHYLGSGGKPTKWLDTESKPVFIGTTAVIHFAEKNGISFDLVAFDEQQKVGTGQREALIGGTLEESQTNLMQSTATCIPQTLGMILCASMSLSRIYPHAQKDITSRIVYSRDRPQMMAVAKEILNSGGKIAVVHSQIKENSDSKSDRQRIVLEKKLQAWHTAFPGICEALHGGMADKEKEEALARMISGKSKILLSTTVIEIGINIPNLQLVAVYDADVYGVSQLHQIRGRLVREGGKGFFFMCVNSNIGDEALERLQNVVNTMDGFVLADADMRARGFGDLLENGTRQHGKSSSLFTNIDISPDTLQVFTDHINQTGEVSTAMDIINQDRDALLQTIGVLSQAQ